MVGETRSQVYFINNVFCQEHDVVTSIVKCKRDLSAQECVNRASVSSNSFYLTSELSGNANNERKGTTQRVVFIFRCTFLRGFMDSKEYFAKMRCCFTIISTRLFPINSLSARGIFRLLTNGLFREVKEVCRCNGDVVNCGSFICVLSNFLSFRLFTRLSQAKNRNSIHYIVRWDKSACANSSTNRYSANIEILVRVPFYYLLNSERCDITTFGTLYVSAGER